MKKSLLFLGLSALLAVASFALDVPANKLVDAAWLKKNMADKSLVVVMVDKDGTYDKEHVVGSVKWTGADFKEGALDFPSAAKFTALAKKSGINKDSVVVFYGSGKDVSTETKATEGLVIADHYGVAKTAFLNGGLPAWKKAGGAVDAAVPAPKAGNFDAKKPTGILLTLADVDKELKAKKAIFVDARPEPFYKGEDTDKRLKQHGRLEGAVSLPAAKLFETKDGIITFKASNDVKALFTAAGVDGKKPVITYCNTGQLASGAWFAAKYLAGFKDTKEYKGSMVEYTNAEPARKVVK